MRPQFFVVATAAALALLIPMGPAQASEKIVGLIGPLDGISLDRYGGDNVLLMKDSYGMIDGLMGVQLKGIKKLQAMAPIDMNIITPEGAGDILTARDGDYGSAHLANNGTDSARHVDKVLNKLNAGDEYPLPPARKFSKRHLENSIAA